jgi:transcriptional regulator with XRE-family HTH domain
MQELEKKSGVKQSYISEIETRKKTGSVATLKALADALNLTVDDLIPN